MKHLIIFAVVIFLTACAEEKSDYVKKLEGEINNTNTAVDSIGKRYDRVMELVNAGMEQSAAERMVDSTDKAEAALKKSFK